MPEPQVEARSHGLGQLAWWERAAAVDAALFGVQLRDGAEGVYRTMDELLDALNGVLSGPDWGPELVPVAAGAATLPVPRDLLSEVLQPVTKLFMQYRNSIKPRCKDCEVFIRFGRLWRTCKTVKKHKARQPGISKFKKKVNRYGGFSQFR